MTNLTSVTDEELIAELERRGDKLPYTAEEVERAVILDDDGWYEVGNRHWETKEYPTLRLRGKDVEVKRIADFGGGEGQGEQTWVVIQVGSQLFRKDGFYQSHYGTDWDGDFREVKEQQKTVTVYE